MKESVIKILHSKLFIIIFSAVAVVSVLDKLFPLPSPKTYSKVIQSSNGTLLTSYLTQDDKWRMRTRLEEVTPELVAGIIAKEDKSFFFHSGVDFTAIVRALYQNIVSRKRESGASTITMQVVRLLEPAERNYFNKFREMIRAYQLELHYSKKEILEMYLSLLPYGGNIEGVKSASYIYFNRPPNKLSLAQSITLAVIPNNPNKFRLDVSTEPVRKMRNYWVKKFVAEETFKKNDLLDALDEPMTAQRFTVPNLAPHFSLFMNDISNEDIVRTTLDLKTQLIAEKLLFNHVNRVKGKNVSNGAVIIIDNKASSVVAYCGSADFNDINASGQVNGVTAIRSPGSTLKPGLYALAFDLGILTPKMRLMDIPTDFGGYEPENYELKFNGYVTAQYALMNSLNIPAVQLLREVTFTRFVNILANSGFGEIAKQKNQLGLSMILGGCGVTLEQLTHFFTLFANGGELYPLNYEIENIGRKEGNKIFTPGSVYLISQILSNNERPDFPNALLYNTNLPRIAWKTGTSFGKKDAWAVGYSPRYTIGVWMGNFDGKGSPHLSGAEMAVPLLFDLFNAVDYGSNKEWFKKPKDVGIRKVCAETGMLPTQYCANTIDDFYLKNISPNKECDLYKEIYVNLNGTIEYCTECLPNEGYKKEAYPVYPPEITLWFTSQNIIVKKPPPHNPLCQAKFSTKGPAIISPSRDFEYLIEEGKKQEILLQAASDATVKKQYWYVNDMYFKECTPGEKIFFAPQKGKIKITCMDDKGRSETVNITVKSY
ncbi:MAG: penicillin-binding protein 1C [bacterium]